ncbi:MAG: quinoprotein dehydrogenase-associated putative ABC transporter substrate-binding protein [Ectothiorhodospiraceae bacterium AqS1]|nr:quinoprotein dehydrogenase-associated putative ABC transporter substrate-binding protein [Ectothiorhodospiraceae bacterium AqS1]
MARSLVLFFFALFMMAGAHASEHENRSAFRVCADGNYLPWSNERGEGFENEIASLLAKSLGLPVEYTWFPQRMGFIRNTLRSRDESGNYRCDVVMGLPAGYELAITTRPYYHSTYALVYIEGMGFDDIRSAEDLLALSPDRKERLRFGLAERNPGTMWLSRYDLLDRIEVAYASQSGDPNERPGQPEQEDLLEGKIDFTFMWGPIAGHFKRSNPDRPIVVIPMHSEPEMQMHFGISAGVRFGDRERKEELQALLDRHADEIEAILRKHGVPLVSDKGL